MFVAIDSAKQMKYSGVVSGRCTELDRVYDEMKKIFIQYNIRDPFHWNKLSRKVKIGCENKIINLVNNCQLNFNIFYHPKPRNILRKEYYLVHVPNSISENLEHWFRYKRGSVEILVDDDYNFGGGHTDDFIINFLRQITFRLVGKLVKIRKENKLKATVKFPNGNILDFYASKSSLSISKEIQMIDIVLGYYIKNPKKFNEKRVFFRKI